MIYALILIIYTQGAQSLDTVVSRIDAAPYVSAKACDDAGQLLSGALEAETDPARQYAWQDYKCVKLEGM